MDKDPLPHPIATEPISPAADDDYLDDYGPQGGSHWRPEPKDAGR